MGLMNRLGSSKNSFQGPAKRVLCVCSAGLLRSPTAAVVLAQEPYNFNTRAAGCVEDYALIPVDEVLIHWADEIVFMTDEHMRIVARTFSDKLEGKDLIVLAVPDDYPYRAPELIERIRAAYDASQVG